MAWKNAPSNGEAVDFSYVIYRNDESDDNAFYIMVYSKGKYYQDRNESRVLTKGMLYGYVGKNYYYTGERVSNYKVTLKSGEGGEGSVETVINNVESSNLKDYVDVLTETEPVKEIKV